MMGVIRNSHQKQDSECVSQAGKDFVIVTVLTITVSVLVKYFLSKYRHYHSKQHIVNDVVRFMTDMSVLK